MQHAVEDNKMTEKTSKEIKEVKKSIKESTKLAHKILEMLTVDGRLPKKSLISVLMILHLMIKDDNKFISLDVRVMEYLEEFGITVEEKEIGN